ncbi:MAG: hypothetical protein V1777_03225 [Candidatus Micrarchaeota archaeon]
MKDSFSAIAESSGDSAVLLSETERRVFEFVLESWPVGPLEVAVHFRHDISTCESKKRASTKFSYYLKKLVEKRLLFSKRMGNSLVVWPVEVEKYRAFHSILNSSPRSQPRQNPDNSGSNPENFSPVISDPKGVV